MLMEEIMPHEQIISLENPDFKNIKHPFYHGPTEKLQQINTC